MFTSTSMESFNELFGTGDLSQRTNSLAFAKVDCHTCAALGQRCDRKRPRCDTCMLSKRKCGGFAMALVWKDPTVPNTTVALSHGESPENIRCNGQNTEEDSSFKFIRGGQKRRKRTKRYGASTRQPTRNASIICSNAQSRFAVTPNLPATSSGSSTGPTTPVSPESRRSHEPLSGSTQFDLQPTTSDLVFDECWPGSNEPTREFEFEPTPPTPITPDSAEDATSEHVQQDPVIQEAGGPQKDSRELTPLMNGISYRNLAHKYGEILALYDEEFCVMPLSADCVHNPFRVPAERCESSVFLLHAILALSSHHLAKKNQSEALTTVMRNHWSAALQLFSKALEQSNPSSILDTILILVNFDTAQSASSPWSMHLTAALGLLDQTKATDWCNTSSRTRAQVAMLVWWDVAIALISRREPIFPQCYLKMLIPYDSRDGWSFFILNGCPAGLVAAMAQLAILSATYERTTKIQWTTFDRTPVDIIIQEVRDYINTEDITLEEMESLDDDLDARRNRFHCVEAWRLAILLYACRVFNLKQDAHQIRYIRHLARLILDNVRSIPNTEVIQKQLLIPVFFAASETGDELSRSFVRQYCKHWNDVSHFYHFESTLILLESIWKDWDSLTQDTYWWGLKVGARDSLSSSTRDKETISELLLG